VYGVVEVCWWGLGGSLVRVWLMLVCWGVWFVCRGVEFSSADFYGDVFFCSSCQQKPLCVLFSCYTLLPLPSY
jgi:hypothetical protein